MKIVSWNVNGIRSIYNKGFLEWFTKESPDILCLQEIKAYPDQFPEPLLKLKGYQTTIASAKKAGYSGVATLSKKKILDTEKLDKKNFDDEGRTLIHYFDSFILINCYFPHGQREHTRVPFKLKYGEALLKKIQSFPPKMPLIIAGDFNTAHTELDLANPKQNIDTSGFLPIERKYLDKFFMTQMIDPFRYLYPQKREYSWWTYRQNCRARNIGWRIDYITVSKNLTSKISTYKHLTKVMGSDHCPVKLVISLDRSSTKA